MEIGSRFSNYVVRTEALVRREKAFHKIAPDAIIIKEHCNCIFFESLFRAAA